MPGVLTVDFIVKKYLALWTPTVSARYEATRQILLQTLSQHLMVNKTGYIGLRELELIREVMERELTLDVPDRLELGQVGGTGAKRVRDRGT